MAEIETAFVQQYSSTLYNLVQQKGSRLRGLVRTEMQRGEYGYYDQIGATEVVERTSRHSPSPNIETPHSRRRVTLRDFEWGEVVDHQDKLRMLIDPTSSYLQSAMWAMGRKVDSVIIAAARGTAYTGKTGGTPVALPTTQKVPLGTNLGLTLTKLLETKEILDGNDVDPEEPRYFIVTSKQVTNLLNTTEIKNADYNTVKALAMGQINSFLGFNFLRTELLENASTTRYCLAWAQSGMLLAMGSDMVGRISERPDLSFSLYAYAKMSFDATRMEEKKVVEIACHEA